MKLRLLSALMLAAALTACGGQSGALTPAGASQPANTAPDGSREHMTVGEPASITFSLLSSIPSSTTLDTELRAVGLKTQTPVGVTVKDSGGNLLNLPLTSATLSGGHGFGVLMGTNTVIITNPDFPTNGVDTLRVTIGGTYCAPLQVSGAKCSATLKLQMQQIMAITRGPAWGVDLFNPYECGMQQQNCKVGYGCTAHAVGTVAFDRAGTAYVGGPTDSMKLAECPAPYMPPSASDITDFPYTWGVPGYPGWPTVVAFDPSNIMWGVHESSLGGEDLNAFYNQQYPLSNGTTYKRITSIVFDKAGDAFVLDAGSGALYKYAGNYGDLNNPLVQIKVSAKASALAFDRNDNLWMADGPNIVEMTTSLVHERVLKTPTGNSSSGIAVDKAGNVAAASYLDGKIYYYTAASSYATIKTLPGNHVHALAFDRDNGLWATDESNFVSYYRAPSMLLTPNAIQYPSGTKTYDITFWP